MTISVPEELASRNPLIQQSVESKGFYLYNWISFDELRKTVSRDYLWLLSKMLIPFGILLVLGGLFDYYILGNIWFTVTLIGGISVYALIFLVIFFRMIIRSWTFLHVSNIVFTDTHLGIGGEIIPYREYNTLQKRIQEWGDEFEEEFMMPSKIDEKIGQFKTQVFSWGASKDQANSKKESASARKNFDFGETLKGYSKHIDTNDFGKNTVIFVFIIFAIIAVYWVSIRVFYAIGWIGSFAIGYFFVGIMKVIVMVQGREEMKIQGLFETLELLSSELISSKNMIVKSLTNATEGAWDQGVTSLVDKFNMTIGKAWSAISLVKKLKVTLEGSKYANIFNFTTFDTWTRSQILEPINEMIKLLSTSLKKLDGAIAGLEKQIVETKDPTYSIPLETQLKRLEMQRNPLLSMQDQWSGIGAKIVMGKF